MTTLLLDFESCHQVLLDVCLQSSCCFKVVEVIVFAYPLAEVSKLFTHVDFELLGLIPLIHKVLRRHLGIKLTH